MFKEKFQVKKIFHFLKRNLEIANLGVNTFFKLKIFFAFFCFSLHHKVFKTQLKSPWIFDFFFLNQKFKLHIGSILDFETFREVFIKEEYLIDTDTTPKIIFDLGSNIGMSVVYFKLKYPQSLVYSFEPDPVSFLKLKKNTSYFSGVVVENIAISGKDGFTKFFTGTNQSLSSSFFRRFGNQEEIQVNTSKLDSLINRFDIREIDVLKFDVEGAEFDIFENFQKINIVRNLIGELHCDLAGREKESFVKIFKGFDCRLFELKKDLRYILKARNKIC